MFRSRADKPAMLISATAGVGGGGAAADDDDDFLLLLLDDGLFVVSRSASSTRSTKKDPGPLLRQHSLSPIDFLKLSFTIHELTSQAQSLPEVSSLHLQSFLRTHV